MTLYECLNAKDEWLYIMQRKNYSYHNGKSVCTASWGEKSGKFWSKALAHSDSCININGRKEQMVVFI